MGPRRWLRWSQSLTRYGQHIVDMEARFERQPLRIRVVLDDALEAARIHHGVDPGRVYPAGHSLGGMLAPDYYDLDRRDPVATAAALDVPVLVIHGGRDYQVTERDLALWRERLSGDDVTIREFAALNHPFIEGTGRATPTEYYSTPGHVARSVIDALAAWISEPQ